MNLINLSLYPFANLYADEINRLEKVRKGLEKVRKEKKETKETRRNVLRWLSRDDSEGTHDRHFMKRFKNTGQWLLDDPSFINWRDGSQSSLLWCHGDRKLQLFPYIYLY